MEIAVRRKAPDAQRRLLSYFVWIVSIAQAYMMEDFRKLDRISLRGLGSRNTKLTETEGLRYTTLINIKIS